MTVTWREMDGSDIAAVTALADAIHPGLVERAEVFAERQRLFPRGCLVAEQRRQILGYAISHPIAPQSPPKLDSLLGALAEGEQHYYIHDFALSPTLRGSGQARAGIEKLLAISTDFPLAALVSVYATADFWSRFGFRPSEHNMQSRLAAYGEHALYMERRIAPLYT